MALGKAGQIVLFRFPQTDLILGSLRPSLFISPIPSSYEDWLVCLISTQIHQAIPDFDAHNSNNRFRFCPNPSEIRKHYSFIAFSRRFRNNLRPINSAKSLKPV